MLRLLALGALTILVAGIPSEKTSRRILSGTLTPITEKPYQVSLEQYGRFQCAGSIVDREFVLTAAHCTHVSLEYLKVRAGTTIVENGGKLHNVKQIYRHHGYDMASPHQGQGYDIALLKISPNFEFNESIQKIPLYTEEIPEKTEVTVSGWGQTEDARPSSYLQSVNMPIVSKRECLRYYAYLPESVFCAGSTGRGSCDGVSGGPVVLNGLQVGIVSFSSTHFHCGKAPHVYTGVSDYVYWIERYTQKPNLDTENPGALLL